MHALWQDQVVSPGDPDHAPEIEEALRATQRLGLQGLAAYLVWVRLLHRIADATLREDVLEAELAAALETYRRRAPLKGSWEQLGLQVSGSLRVLRPAVDRSGVDALVEDVIRQKESSLPAEERPAFRASRRRWQAGR
jgi:hypothetical protein